MKYSKSSGSIEGRERLLKVEEEDGEEAWLYEVEEVTGREAGESRKV